MKRREVLCLALVTLVPQLLGGRGRLNADTKQYLYLDPLDLLDRSRHVWDARVGGGAVTHQAIGYLWPMGPYYALMDAVGVPDWVAQRLWVGGLQLIAAVGALALLRRLLPATWLHLPAALAYGLSPFVLGHVTGQSGLLVPFAGLPWLVLAMTRATEEPRSWRWPAAFALLVTTCGSLNGSSVFFVVLAAALWVPFAVLEHDTASPRDGTRVLLRAGGLTLLTQLWWLTAYAVGGAYNLPILQLTENVDTTNATTSAPEVLRGLGYWFFYGRDTEGPWLADLSTPYLTSGWLLLTSFAIPIVALLAGAVLRWRYRSYFALLTALGTVVAVGAYPRADPSLAGEAFASLSRQSDLVLSLRNTQRAGALVALGLAGLLAAGLDALRRRHAGVASAGGVVVLALVALALPAQWRTGLIAERFSRDDELPTFWTDAATELESGDGRVLELPGIDFASYRWGHTLDPVSVGLTDRPIMARELVPLGGAAGVDLLQALDRSMQEGWFEPEALAPVARLFGATEVLVRNDLEYERYRTARPRALWPQVVAAGGLGPARTFGEGYENRAGPKRPMIDELELGLDPNAPDPPALAIFDVLGADREVLGVAPLSGGIVVDGDGEGIVSAAAAGLLEEAAGGPLLLGADVMAEGDLDDVTDGATAFIVTDTYRKRANRWYSLRENVGATEPADMGVVEDDPSDARLSLADETPGTRTVVDWRGVHRIWASTYGSQLTLVPEERPSNAFDGDPATAWRASPLDDGEPRRIGIELDDPVAARAIRFLPPVGRPGTTLPTRVAITLDGERRSVVDLDPTALRSRDGAEVELDGEPFERLEVELLAAEHPTDPSGFAEIQIPGVTMAEIVVLPTAVLDALGSQAAQVPVTVLLTRQRANPAEPVRADPEPSMHRRFELPTALRTTLRGTVRIDPAAPEAVLDSLLGAGPDVWPVRVTTSERLAGDLDARGSSVLDGDSGTAWQTPLVGIEGQHLDIGLPQAITLDHLDLEVVTDGRHSLPRRIQLRADGGAPVVVDLPALDIATPSGRTPVSVALPAALRGTTLEVTIADADETTTTDWYSGEPVALPVGIAELALPGVPQRPTVADVEPTCRDDLVELGGLPLAVRLIATDAADGALALEGCEGEVELPAGSSELRTAPGRVTGLAVDRLALSSPGEATPARPTATQVTQIDDTSAGHVSGTVETDGEPFWLRVDQSTNDGWELAIDGATVDGPRPLDAFANGWLVRPDGPGTLRVTATWAPQRNVDIALLVSALGVLACAALLLHRRTGRRDITDPPAIARAPVGPEWWRVVAGAVLAGLLVDPLAVPVAVVLLVAARWRPWIGRVAPVVLVAAAGAGVFLLQQRHGYPPTFDWPTRFPWVHPTALLGIVVLLATSLPGALRRDPDSVHRS